MHAFAQHENYERYARIMTDVNNVVSGVGGGRSLCGIVDSDGTDGSGYDEAMSALWPDGCTYWGGRNPFAAWAIHAWCRQHGKPDDYAAVTARWARWCDQVLHLWLFGHELAPTWQGIA